MLQILSLKDIYRSEFERLFADYYEELDCGEDTAHLIDEYIIPDLLAGLIAIDLLKDDGRFVGFVIYQKDDINNEWNLKEGWGDIREIYIAPAFRRKGYGRFLLYTAEMRLNSAGTGKSYCLPYEEAIPFFTACGYAECGEYSEELDCPVLAKEDLNNHCK